MHQHHIGSTDSGGLIARIVAAHDPRVAGIVLGNTEIPGYTPFMLKLYVVMARLGIVAPMTRLLLRTPWLRRSQLGFGECFTDPRFVDGDFYDAILAPLADPRALRGHLRLLDTLNDDTVAGLAQLHARIVAPVELVWGADDPWFPLARAKLMMAEFGGAVSLTEIPGGKLFAHEDHVVKFAAAARRHLSACWSATREQAHAS